MNEHEELEVLDALALGTLDPVQRAAVETHLAQCASCRHAYDEVRSVIDVLPHALTAPVPPGELLERIMRAIDAPTSPVAAQRARRRRFPLAATLAAGLLIALIGDGYLVLRPMQTNDDTIAASTTPQPPSARTSAPPTAPPAAINRPATTKAPTTNRTSSTTPPTVAHPSSTKPQTSTRPSSTKPSTTNNQVATKPPATTHASANMPLLADQRISHPGAAGTATLAALSTKRGANPHRAADSDAARIAALEQRLAATQSTAKAEALRIARLTQEIAQMSAVPPRGARGIVSPATHGARTTATKPHLAADATPRVAATPTPRVAGVPASHVAAVPTPRVAGTPAPHVAATVSEPSAATASAAPAVATAGSPGDANLVAALRTGKVYAIDGAVDGQPWHLTIVQPHDGGRAVIYSGTPDAPSGQTYRTWVIRSGRTVSIGELTPAKPATLEMPMALEAGDIVAFSREPVGSGDVPTQPFLMQFKVSP